MVYDDRGTAKKQVFWSDYMGEFIWGFFRVKKELYLVLQMSEA